MSARIYTRTGDEGETSLLGGLRVPKDDLRVQACGAVDELNSALGLVLALDPPADVSAVVNEVQGLLFELGDELATSHEKSKHSQWLTDDDVTWLEARIDEHDARLPRLTSFVMPSGTRAGAALHLGRSICRRAERVLVTLRREHPEIRVLSVSFMNRLADLLFVLARSATLAEGCNEVIWRPFPP